MKGIIVMGIMVLLCTGKVRASGVDTAAVRSAMQRFPGFSMQQMEQLLKAKGMYCVPSDIDEKEKGELSKATGGHCAIPLPTWLPDGFHAEKVVTKLGRNVRSDDMELYVVYSRKMKNGKKQLFVLEALFEFGDLPYDKPVMVKTALGTIQLYYEPVDDSISADKKNWGKKTTNYVMTSLFCADKACYPQYEYNSIASDLVRRHLLRKGEFSMISIEETKRILGSMREL